jgi:hypothetical protein
MDALVDRLTSLADGSGRWSIRSEEVIRLVGADPVRFWRELNGLRHRISFGEAIDGFTQDTVGDLVTVLESLMGDGPEEALRRAGLFVPHGDGAELTGELLHAARRFSAAHAIATEELAGMIRHTGSVRAAVELYLREHTDRDRLVEACAESFRATRGLPPVGRAAAARYLHRLFDRHVLDRVGIFSLLEERLRTAAVGLGYADAEDRKQDDRAGRGADGGVPRGRRAERRTWALGVMGFAGGGAEPDADALRSRYRKLMMRLHPDVDPSGLERCKDVNAAYALLIAETTSAA